MYKMSFNDVDKKVLRAVKGIKAKNGHTLYAADQMLNSIHASLTEQTKLTLVVSDLDNEIDYNFEDKAINPNDAAPSLMDILEEDIIASGHENAQKILDELQKQYQLEASQENTSEQTEKNSRTDRASKKGANLLGRFKRGSKTENQNNPLLNDFDDLEEDAAKSKVVADDFDDLTQAEDEISVPEETWDSGGQEQAEETISVSDDELDFEQFPTTQPESEEYVPEAENDEMLIGDEYEAESINNDVYDENSVYKTTQKKNERIVFPTYASYLDLSTSNGTVNRHKERFEPAHLINFLGLNTSGAGLSDLDQIKLKYAANALNDSKFVLLKDYFHNAIGNISDKTQTKLSQVYEQALGFDYQEESIKKIDEDLQKIYAEGDTLLADYQKEQEEEAQNKLEKFEFEQQKALEDFIRKQELEKSSYVQDLNAKKSSRIALLKDNTQKEISDKKETLLDEQMFDLKNQWVNQLTETKRLSVREFESQVDDAVDDAWVNIQKALGDLKQEINANVPNWKKELEEQRKLEQEDREERRKEEQLEVEKQRIELQRAQLEITTNHKKEVEEDAFEKIINKKFSEYDKRLAEHLQQVIPTENHSPMAVEQKPAKSGINKKKSFLMFGIAGILAVSGFAGHSIGNNNAAATPVQAQETNQVEELASKMELLEASLVVPTADSSEAENLDSLLKDKEFEKAMRSYTDPESLNKIEQKLFESKELGTLITFNKTYESEFGAIDEATLSEDAKKVKKLYSEMKDKEIENLSSDRKSSIALLLYQVGEKEMADKLLGTKKEK